MKGKMKMVKTVGIVILSLFFLSQAASGQSGNENLKRLADESGRAFVNRDFSRLVDLTYPKLVVLLGGRTKMIAFLERGVREMRAQGAEMLSMSPSEPTQVTTIGRQVFAVLPVTMRIKVPEGVLVGESFMIGVSSDRGKSWTFVNGDNLDERRMRVLFPSAVGKLKLPPVKPPTLSTGQQP